METAKINMIEQLRQKYLWKYGFSDMAKLGDASGQIGGWRSGDPSAIMCDENFHQIGTHLFSTHIRFQLYPILPVPKLFWPWKWASKLKSHFLKASFSQPTFKGKWVGEPDYCKQFPRRFQLYPILPVPKIVWPWKWPSKLKSHFLRGSFFRLTFKSGGDPV